MRNNKCVIIDVGTGLKTFIDARLGTVTTQFLKQAKAGWTRKGISWITMLSDVRVRNSWLFPKEKVQASRLAQIDWYLDKAH